MAIQFPKEKQDELVQSIRRFFEEHMDDKIGDLKAFLLYDYILKEFGPVVYNRAIEDAKVYFHDRTEDLDGTCFHPENEFWR